eukprot:5203641-Pleurochrysis_carterae.AAC.1
MLKVRTADGGRMERTCGHVQAIKKVKKKSLEAADEALGADAKSDETSDVPLEPTAEADAGAEVAEKDGATGADTVDVAEEDARDDEPPPAEIPSKVDVEATDSGVEMKKVEDGAEKGGEKGGKEGGKED